MDADVIVVGGGLAGLVATAELADAGRRVILLDQEPEASLGGQAFWSFGGLFLVDTPEQRRLRVKDSSDLGLAGLGGLGGVRPRRRTTGDGGGRAPMSSSPPGRSVPGCTQQGMRWFPVVGWAERGGYGATGHGNSVPRFHVTWGTGPGVVEPFERRVRAAVARGLVEPAVPPPCRQAHRDRGAVGGVAGAVLEPERPAARRVQLAPRGRRFRAARPGGARRPAGGIGGNHDLVRRLLARAPRARRRRR